jgi:O-antigen/teichoic acid export membrane protein
MQIAPLVVALSIGPRLEWLIAASLAARGLGIVIPAVGLAKEFALHRQPMRLSRRELGALAGFGAWVMVSALVGPFMTISDRFVIGALAGAAAVAAYTIPLQIAARTALLPISLVQALFPRFAAQDGPAARAHCGEATVFVGQIYAPMAIGLACLAAPLLRLWLGDALDVRSILIGQIALAGFWANSLANVPYSYLQARGNPRFTALLHVAELPVYVALLFALGSRWGLAGFATAYALRCALDAGMLMAKAGVWRRDVLAPLAGPALLVAAAIPAGQAFQTWPGALASAAVLGFAAAALAWWQMPATARDHLGKLPLMRRFAS